MPLDGFPVGSCRGVAYADTVIAHKALNAISKCRDVLE